MGKAILEIIVALLPGVGLYFRWQKKRAIEKITEKTRKMNDLIREYERADEKDKAAIVRRFIDLIRS